MPALLSFSEGTWHLSYVFFSLNSAVLLSVSFVRLTPCAQYMWKWSAASFRPLKTEVDVPSIGYFYRVMPDYVFDILFLHGCHKYAWIKGAKQYA